MLTPENDEDVRRGMRIAGQMAIGLLVRSEFDVLEAMTSSRHMSAVEFQRAIETLGGQLIEVPEEEWSQIAIRSRTAGQVDGYDFMVPLWTTDGRSDTGIALRLVPTTYGTFEIEVHGFVPLEADHSPGSPIADQTTCPNNHEDQSQPSDSPVPERWRPVLGQIVHRLTLGDYEGLVADGLVSYTDDPNDTSIGRWIEDYPATLVDLPEEAWRYSEHGPRVNAPESWWVVVDLWTAEEGRSDLSLEATIWDDGTSVEAKIDNVHVM